VTIDRPAKLNAISPEVTATLWEATRALGDREDLRVMVITSVGRYFTAGIDLAHIPGDRRGGQIPSDVAYRRQYREHHLLYDEFEAIEKPIVLAAQGPCLGAGVEMAASCDFRLAAESAYFELPEIRLGVLAGSGGTSRVTRLVGPHWGKWMAMAGQRVGSEQAKSIGFVHDVYPDGAFATHVEEFARQLVAIPGEAWPSWSWTWSPKWTVPASVTWSASPTRRSTPQMSGPPVPIASGRVEAPAGYRSTTSIR
jgi:enoyl-CoA hydratase